MNKPKISIVGNSISVVIAIDRIPRYAPNAHKITNIVTLKILGVLGKYEAKAHPLC
jgi:hypothetical protein